MGTVPFRSSLFDVDELSDQEDEENTDPNVNANVNVNMAQV